MFNCESCNKTFSVKCNLLRHYRSVHAGTLYQCHLCESRFSRSDKLSCHLKICKVSCKRPAVSVGGHEEQDPCKKLRYQEDKQVGGSSPFSCEICTTTFTEKRNLLRHMRNVHSGDSCKVDELIETSDKLVETALKRNILQIDLSVNNTKFSLDILLENLRPDIIKNIQESVSERNGVKWQLIVTVRFTRSESWMRDDVLETITYFRSKASVALQETDLDEHISKAISKILESSQQFVREGSGWKYDSVQSVKLCIATYEPLAASSYIPLPKKLQNTKSIINIQNEDQKCFLWSVLAGIHNVGDKPHRVSQYKKFENTLDTSGLEFPVPITNVRRFAKRNQLTINVYGYDTKSGVYPLLIDGNTYPKHIDLLLLAEEDKQHYCLIRSMSRLLSHLTKHNGARFYCQYCLHRFCREDLLQNHIGMCSNHEAQKTILPDEGDSIMKFRDIKKQLKVPYIVYADFESFAVKIHGPKPSSNVSSTTTTTQHVPSGFCFVVIGPNGMFFQEPVIYHGENVVELFFEKLIEVQNIITPLLKTNKPMLLTDTDEISFISATNCHICLLPFEQNDIRVKDHDHLTGLYRGAAHQKCNLEYQVCDFIPVVFHNLRSYDAHILMHGIGKIKDQKITCIAQNLEKYISFSLGNLRFVDSLQFLSASLDSLVNNLAKSGENAFQSVRQFFPEDKIPLLLRKGVFPYEFLDSVECFKVTELPPPDAFYNKLTETMISIEDYEHAQNVWNAFEMKNFAQYHNLYMTLDVLLLSDVFENFRKVCMEHYRLDPAQYYTLPGVAWTASLLKSRVELELFTDPNMYLFIEKGLRGGISMISNRFSKANNPYVDGYDETKPRTYISYIDMNNLYGCAMIDYLPVGSFKWMSDFSSFDVNKVANDSPTGYILEVDLDYPKELHDSHSDYPLAPERMTINEEMLSPYSMELLSVLGIKHTGKVEKLVPNLLPKKNYVLHYRNLKLYLSLGLKLEKIHRVLQFNQRPWLKPYIDFNTEKRKEAKSDFEKDFFKLMNNAVFGKSMENPRKHVNVHLVHTPKQLKKLVAKPSYKSCRIFSEDLVGVEMMKTTLKLNKPIYTGLTILDLSKLLMYDFHYNHMLPKYGSKMQLNFTDTDSFSYSIETEDLYRDMAEDAHLYDFSDYPVGHFLHSTANMKKLGKFKDEVSGGYIEEFVGLRPKCYSIKTTKGEKKTAKGVGKTTTKRDLDHEKYKSCLTQRKLILAEMNRIRSTKHQLYSVTLRKIGLSPADDKRYILDDGTRTLAFGHYKIHQ